MNTTFELVKSARYYLEGKKDDFARIFSLSLNDLYFQTYFITTDPNKIVDQVLELYARVVRETAVLESPDHIAEWLNKVVTENNGIFIETQRAEQLKAEERGELVPPQVPIEFLSGAEMDDAEFTVVLENALCKLPEIHRATALAFYYNDMSTEVICECLQTDPGTLKTRLAYIEKSVTRDIHNYCKERGYKIKAVDARRILIALSELQKGYVFPDPNGLYRLLLTKVKIY
ncbi:MAG: hypothetical protein MJ105_01855 [Lachnospiraceae bacterium]|nr:hypothetical protein [Lachnospiraceae bacterium]